MTVLLEIFNDLWITGNVPKIWKEAIIIPIPKPGKDNADPTNYRPISLTSCVCKTMERMINSRLVWYLESNNLISPFQSGFRHGRSTNDHLVRLETFFRDDFIKREHLVAVFFNLEKAYDTTWKNGIPARSGSKRPTALVHIKLPLRQGIQSTSGLHPL